MASPFAFVLVDKSFVTDAAQVDEHVEPCALYGGFQVEGGNAQIAGSVGVGASQTHLGHLQRFQAQLP